MNTRSFVKGVSVAATVFTIVFGGVGIASIPSGLVQVASAQESAALAAGQTVVITGDVVNVRSDASIDSDIVTTLQNGTWATVVDGPVASGDYDWYQIEYDDFTGWVAADYLADAGSSASLSSGDTVIVNTEVLNLRSDAGSTSEIVEILDGSTEGQVIGGPTTVDDMVWYQVDFDGAQGWVSRSYLALPATDETEVTTGVLATATAAATPDAAI